MPNNYLEFSETIENLKLCEIEWWEKKAREVSVAYEKDPDSAYDDRTACIDFSVDKEKKRVWFHADENGDPYKVGCVVQQFLKLFRANEYFSLTWACWCSKPRIGEFDGGAIFVTADEIRFHPVCEWVEQVKREWEEDYGV